MAVGYFDKRDREQHKKNERNGERKSVSERRRFNWLGLIVAGERQWRGWNAHRIHGTRARACSFYDSIKLMNYTGVCCMFGWMVETRVNARAPQSIFVICCLVVLYWVVGVFNYGANLYWQRWNNHPCNGRNGKLNKSQRFSNETKDRQIDRETVAKLKWHGWETMCAHWKSSCFIQE